ncbi:MAG TPA: response regulator [Candidatus Methylacidiphilales bacterium]
MKRSLSSPVIVTIEDDEGHAILIRENLEAAGLGNEFVHLRNGQEALDFLFRRGGPAPEFPRFDPERPYVLLLDIRMPKVDGIEVLRQVKADVELRPLPVVMLTTTDDERDVERCYFLGCNAYLRKPLDYDAFVSSIRNLARFLGSLELPAPLGACPP